MTRRREKTNWNLAGTNYVYAIVGAARSRPLF